MIDLIQSNIKKAAQTIRETLLETEFSLEDMFSDAEDLKQSWEDIVIYSSVCVFFLTVFDINQTKLMSHGSGEHSYMSN